MAHEILGAAWGKWSLVANPLWFKHIETRMAGYIHITRLSARTGSDNLSADEYQVNYNTGGVTYAITWTEDQLAEFLRVKVPLEPTEFNKVMREVHEIGHANIGKVEISETEASALGMEMMPDDF